AAAARTGRAEETGGEAAEVRLERRAERGLAAATPDDEGDDGDEGEGGGRGEPPRPAERSASETASATGRPRRSRRRGYFVLIITSTLMGAPFAPITSSWLSVCSDTVS